MEGSAQSAVAVRLEDYEEGFLAGLARQGYASRSREAQRYLVRHLSRWLAMRGLAVSELSEGVGGQYAAARRQERSHLRSERALRPLLGYLRGLGVVPAAAAAVPESAGEVLLARFAAYLAGERGLAAATVSGVGRDPLSTSNSNRTIKYSATTSTPRTTYQGAGSRP